MVMASELRNLSESELEEKVSSLKKELFELKALARSERIEKPHRIGQAKKDIARILTILKERK